MGTFKTIVYKNLYNPNDFLNGLGLFGFISKFFIIETSCNTFFLLV